jgi:Family of unknown function (DUF6527)
MMRYTRLKHQFVTNLPEGLEPGVLYISIEYAIAAHLCCCGCGVEVVTPFTPTDWNMTFDGETISLFPSVGNWNDACRSHYVIERSEVIEAPPWSDERIEAEFERDRAAKKEFYKDSQQPVRSALLPEAVSSRESWLLPRVKRWFGKLNW